MENKDSKTGQILGRCFRFAPEVDGEVLIEPSAKGNKANIGMLVPALITGASLYDLTAEFVGAEKMVHAARTMP